MPDVACSYPKCPETYPHASGISDREAEYVAGLRGWGIVGIVKLCPAHAGRKQIRIPELTHLPGQLSLWGDEEPPAPVAKRSRPRTMKAKDHHA